MKPTSRLAAALDSHRSTLGSLLVVVLLANVFTVVRSATATRDPDLVAMDPSGALPDGHPDLLPAPGLQPSAGVTGASRDTALPSGTPSTDVRRVAPGRVIPGKGTVPNGIDGNELTLVYYWKGDQTKSSQFLNGDTGQEGNVDEGLAFKHLIAWINKHASDGSTLMGYRFDLGNWRFKPIVIDAGKGDDVTRAAERIASEIKPFAAVSSHGSISAYVCPRLVRANIFNVSTYDLDFGLYDRTGGMCLPQGLSFDAQVELMESYLLKDRTRAYSAATGSEARRYGLLYAEYPGLVDSAPVIERRFKAAGIPIVETASVDPDLTTAGRQQPGVIAKFRAAGVNTIVAPDSGSLITFTHAAAAAGYTPDYSIWPCSGEDSTGMVRLYDAGQWTRASGLTCYDEHLNADLTNDDIARQSEWYRNYQEMAGRNAEPPAPTSLVYQSLLPLLVGVTEAGRDLTLERFQAGVGTLAAYRYDAIEGKTTNPMRILVTMDAPDGSQVGDAGLVRWNASRRTPGNATPGAYDYLGDRRYARGAAF